MADGSDITERLAERIGHPHSHYISPDIALLMDAKAEIERLRAQAPGWRGMESERPGVFPFNGERLLLCWRAFRSIPAPVELGRWRSGTGAGSGWCNTYGHSFGGTPDFYMPLPSPPAEGGE